LDRNDWVSLGDLVEGENLATELGPISVSSLELYRTTEPVYNLETHGEHVYQVTQLGLLVHNAYPKLRNGTKPRGEGWQIAHIFPRRLTRGVPGIKTARALVTRLKLLDNAKNLFWAKSGHMGTHTTEFLKALAKEFKGVTTKAGAERAIARMWKRINDDGEFLKR
jgi:hypothetical protein